MKRSGWGNVVCVASGPSLSMKDCALAMASGYRIIAVNNNYLSVPSADVLYASDRKWYAVHIHGIRRAGFLGELWTQDEDAAAEFGLRHIKSIRGDYLPSEPDRITQGSNSGHAAIQLAARFGATRIVLLGYDMRRGADGKKHWHADHANPLGNGEPTGWIPRFTRLAEDLEAAGVTVINATISTALTQFRREPLDIALGMVTA